MKRMRALASAGLIAWCTACVGTTGGEVVDFQAAAAGPADARVGQSLRFQGSRGFEIELTKARLHVGALYLSDNQPASGAQVTSCILPGSYVAQVIEGRDIDLLSGKPQLFPVLGHGTTTDALSAQVWLTGGDVNDLNDPPQPTVVLALTGTARRDALRVPFEANLTIAGNRIPAGGGFAGADPICLERIVSPIPVALKVQTEGALLLRIDPRGLFTNVDFGSLPAAQTESGERYVFKDGGAENDQPSTNLYQNLKQAGSVYRFSWVTSLN